MILKLLVTIPWDSAPEWAKYAAMDSNGTWYWYEAKPKVAAHGKWQVDLTRYRMQEFYMVSSYEQTLRRRPK